MNTWCSRCSTCQTYSRSQYSFKKRAHFELIGLDFKLISLFLFFDYVDELLPTALRVAGHVVGAQDLPEVENLIPRLRAAFPHRQWPSPKEAWGPYRPWKCIQVALMESLRDSRVLWLVLFGLVCNARIHFPKRTRPPI